MTDPLKELRDQFEVTDHHIYLNHAAVSPLPRRCRELMTGYLDELGRHGAAHYPDPILGPLARVRRLGARLLGGADPEHVFIVRSTTQGLSLAATGIPVKEGDNVVLVEREFPANLRPWLPLRSKGVEVRLVPQRGGRVLLDDLAAAADDRTVALSVSFVQFLSGFRLDPAPVAELCRRHDALFVLDAIQGLGAFPLDVEAAGVDLLSADAHKWMLGPEGVGLGYASARALERIQPAVEGWLAVERPFDFFDLDQPLKAGGGRFEEGAYNVAGVNGFRGCLELILEAGVDTISEQILGLTDRLAEGLKGLGWSVLSPRETRGGCSGIVLTTREGIDFETLPEKLDQRGIVASARGGALRLSPHGYNTVEEIERVLEVLGEVG